MEKKKFVAFVTGLIIILLAITPANAIKINQKKDDYPQEWNDMNAIEIAKDIQSRIEVKPWKKIKEPEIVPLNPLVRSILCQAGPHGRGPIRFHQFLPFPLCINLQL